MSTSADATRRRKTSFPRSDLRLIVIDRLFAFCARNDAPISFPLSSDEAPSCRARSPVPGVSTLMTSAPSSASW